MTSDRQTHSGTMEATHALTRVDSSSSTSGQPHRKRLVTYLPHLPLPRSGNAPSGASSPATTPLPGVVGREDLNPDPPYRARAPESSTVGVGAGRGGPDGPGLRMVVMKWRGRGKRKVVLPLLKFGCQRCMQTMKQRYHRHFLAPPGAAATRRRCCCQVSPLGGVYV